MRETLAGEVEIVDGLVCRTDATKKQKSRGSQVHRTRKGSDVAIQYRGNRNIGYSGKTRSVMTASKLSTQKCEDVADGDSKEASNQITTDDKYICYS